MHLAHKESLLLLCYCSLVNVNLLPDDRTTHNQLSANGCLLLLLQIVDDAVVVAVANDEDEDGDGDGDGDEDQKRTRI